MLSGDSRNMHVHIHTHLQSLTSAILFYFFKKGTRPQSSACKLVTLKLSIIVVWPAQSATTVCDLVKRPASHFESHRLTMPMSNLSSHISWRLRYILVSEQQRHIELQVQSVSVLSVLDREKSKQEKSQLHLMPESPKSLPCVICT